MLLEECKTASTAPPPISLNRVLLYCLTFIQDIKTGTF